MDVSALKTVMGRQQFKIKMGLGLRNTYIAQTLAPLFDLSVLVDCGIEPGSPHVTLTLLSPDMSDKVLSALLEFWRSMAALGICFVSTYEWGMPGMVFGLLSDVEEQRQEVLVRMQTLFKQLEALETLACENSDLQSIVMDLAWPRGAWSRELLVGCCKMGWSGLPDELDGHMVG